VQLRLFGSEHVICRRGPIRPGRDVSALEIRFPDSASEDSIWRQCSVRAGKVMSRGVATIACFSCL